MTPILIDITLICAIVALILACIVPAICCYFGCLCSCCCRNTKDIYIIEQEKKGNSVRYCVKSTRSKSQSKSEGGSPRRSKSSTRTAREKSIP